MRNLVREALGKGGRDWPTREEIGGPWVVRSRDKQEVAVVVDAGEGDDEIAQCGEVVCDADEYRTRTQRDLKTNLGRHPSPSRW